MAVRVSNELPQRELPQREHRRHEGRRCAVCSDHLLLEALGLCAERGEADRGQEREEAERRDPKQREEPEHAAGQLEEPNL